jgi:hypothetical protein
MLVIKCDDFSECAFSLSSKSSTINPTQQREDDWHRVVPLVLFKRQYL